MGLSYDSNVYVMLNQFSSDVLLIVLLLLLLCKQGDGCSIMFIVSGIGMCYCSYFSENSIDYEIDVSGCQCINIYGVMFGGLGYSWLYEDCILFDDVLGIWFIVFIDGYVYFGIEQCWVFFLLCVGGMFDYFFYCNVMSVVGELIDNVDCDCNVIGVGFCFGYIIVLYVDVFVQGIYDECNYWCCIDDYGY